MLTISDLRWMEERRRRAALRRMLESEDPARADPGLRREVAEIADMPEGTDPCDHARDDPALAHRPGCPG